MFLAQQVLALPIMIMLTIMLTTRLTKNILSIINTFTVYHNKILFVKGFFKLFVNFLVKKFDPKLEDFANAKCCAAMSERAVISIK